MSGQSIHAVPVLPSYGSTHDPTLSKKTTNEDPNVEVVHENEIPEGEPADKHHGLHRGLTARQVSMIAIAGTIGTGLFLGTGRSLAQGGPASMLICYALIGLIVYITLLLLGEMATQYPVAGESVRPTIQSRALTYVLPPQVPSTRMRHASSPRRTDLPSHGTTGSTTRSLSRQISPLRNSSSVSGPTTTRGS